MSKIGQYALDIQEQVNEMGFSTIQEALDAGYEVIDDTLVKADELEKAHEAWLKEKDELLGDLNNLLMGMSMVGKTPENSTDCAIVERAYKFIKENCNDR